MRLQEHEGLERFAQFGIPVPERGLAVTAEEAVEVANRIGYPVMVKAQVLVGGRGLAGGIREAFGRAEFMWLQKHQLKKRWKDFIRCWGSIRRSGV